MCQLICKNFFGEVVGVAVKPGDLLGLWIGCRLVITIEEVFQAEGRGMVYGYQGVIRAVLPGGHGEALLEVWISGAGFEVQYYEKCGQKKGYCGWFGGGDSELEAGEPAGVAVPIITNLKTP